MNETVRCNGCIHWSEIHGCCSQRVEINPDREIEQLKLKIQILEAELKNEKDLHQYHKKLTDNLEKEILAQRRIFNEEAELRKENEKLKAENEKVFAAYKEWEDVATDAVKENQQVKSDIALREKEIVDMKVWYANLGTINQKLEQENQQLKDENEQLKNINFDKVLKEVVCPHINELKEQLEKTDSFYRGALDEIKQLKAQLEQAQSKPVMLTRYCMKCGIEDERLLVNGLCDKCGQQPKPERKPQKCPVCDGTGKERLYKSFVNLFAVLRDNHCQDAEGVVWKTCDSCEGIGIVWENK